MAGAAVRDSKEGDVQNQAAELSPVQIERGGERERERLGEGSYLQAAQYLVVYLELVVNRDGNLRRGTVGSHPAGERDRRDRHDRHDRHNGTHAWAVS